MVCQVGDGEHAALSGGYRLIGDRVERFEDAVLRGDVQPAAGAGVTEDARVARAVFVCRRAAEHAGEQRGLLGGQGLRGRDHGFELDVQLVAVRFQNVRKRGQRGGIAVQVFRTVAVDKADIFGRVLGPQVVGGQDAAVFEQLLAHALLALLVGV